MCIRLPSVPARNLGEVRFDEGNFGASHTRGPKLPLLVHVAALGEGSLLQMPSSGSKLGSESQSSGGCRCNCVGKSVEVSALKKGCRFLSPARIRRASCGTP